MEPTEVLAMVGGYVDQELLLRNEYLAAENEILKCKIEGPVRLTSPERIRLAKISTRVGRKGLERVPCIVKPGTLATLVLPPRCEFSPNATDTIQWRFPTSSGRQRV